MRPIAPRVKLDGVDMPEIGVAEDQPEYKPIVIAPVYHGDGTVTVLTRWTFTEEERLQVLMGADVYVGTVHAIGYQMNPMGVSITPEVWGLDAN